MIVFVVSRGDGVQDPPALAARLETIRVRQGRRNAVVAVDRPYGRDAGEPPSGPRLASFGLDDFMSTKGRRAAGDPDFDPDLLMKCLERPEREWLLIDFGHHGLAKGREFVDVLSRGFFMSPAAKHHRLVLVVPSVHLPEYLRAANAAFNVLPENAAGMHRSAAVNAMFARSVLERVVEWLPFVMTFRRVLAGLLGALLRRGGKH